MVLEMRRRGIRIDVDAAQRARDHLFAKRDAVFAEISEKLGTPVSMAEIGRNKWLAETFDTHGIKYPRTQKGNPSFTAGNSGWMPRYKHWLPPLIVKADRLNNAAANFLQHYILDHVVNGRIHAEIHPHRSDEGGTRSTRFSYSDPPLQLMPAHDEELTALIRGVFLPEEGEVWAKPDISQQEFRFIVHYAARHKLPGAQQAVDRYRNDPNTDFHTYVAEITGSGRQPAKSVNFAKVFGAGVGKLAAMINKSEAEARAIVQKYDRELPFVHQLAELCRRTAQRQGYIELYDGGRRHWSDFETPGVADQGRRPLLARRSGAPHRRSRSSLVSPPRFAPCRHPQGDERADPRLGGAAYKIMDAGMLARRHRPASADARRARMFGVVTGAGRTCCTAWL
jgi:DNA polymerase I-like protein with 3'-5' exonuclease and polymerase domains